MNSASPPIQDQNQDQTPEQIRLRKRAWNKQPLLDLFPRIPAGALERVLDVVIEKNFTYNLSESKFYNARRYTSILIAHIRHFSTPYDSLLRSGTERFAARKQTGPQVWSILREWCPWDESNEVLRRCFEATLWSPEERDSSWDPMDVDDESDQEEEDGDGNDDNDDDPMDLD